jgi:hypothetical protein
MLRQLSTLLRPNLGSSQNGKHGRANERRAGPGYLQMYRAPAVGRDQHQRCWLLQTDCEETGETLGTKFDVGQRRGSGEGSQKKSRDEQQEATKVLPKVHDCTGGKGTPTTEQRKITTRFGDRICRDWQVRYCRKTHGPTGSRRPRSRDVVARWICGGIGLASWIGRFRSC